MTTVGVVGNRRYEGLPEVLAMLLRLSHELGMTLAFEDDLHALAGGGNRLTTPSGLDLMLTLGGDGTMLRGARFLAGLQVPVLGINLGRLGFLTCCGGDELQQSLERFAAGEHFVETRMALEAHALRDAGGGGWRAVNDVVLHKGGFARVINLRIAVNAEPIATFAGDGVIISTPTGSTAYSLSAGGPVVVPTVESIIVTAVSAHTLAIRPVVLPPAADVTVSAEDGPDELLVTIDGQVGAILAPGDTLRVRRSDKPVLMVRFSDATFFVRMRRKLGWGGLRERDEPDRC